MLYHMKTDINKDNCKGKIIILISHRKSTDAICDKVYKLENRKIDSVKFRMKK